jgi:aspartate carbamoyltransferase catalytic subunit
MTFPRVLESISDLTKTQIDDLLTRSREFKFGSTPLYNHQNHVAFTLFKENSTRTKLSFTVAAKRLGMVHIDFNADTSSLKKGETLLETLQTLKAMGGKVVIYRTNLDHELRTFKENPPIPLINAGDGHHEHPTQALLDLFTLKECEGHLEGKTLAIVGDCFHSRVCHSLLKLLPQYGIKPILVGPKEFIKQSEDLPSNIQRTENLQEAVEQSDFLYLLRVQLERHKDLPDSVLENYSQNYGINLEKLKSFHKEIPIYHAGPTNVGVEVDQDIIHSPLFRGREEVAHSIPMRMAILESLIKEEL